MITSKLTLEINADNVKVIRKFIGGMSLQVVAKIAKEQGITCDPKEIHGALVDLYYALEC